MLMTALMDVAAFQKCLVEQLSFLLLNVKLQRTLQARPTCRS